MVTLTQWRNMDKEMAGNGVNKPPSIITDNSDNSDSTPTPRHQPTMLSIKRRLYTRVDLDKEHPYQDDSRSLWKRLQDSCSCMRFLQILVGYFPIIGVVRHYKWRNDVIQDIMAGISVAFLQIPQGFALGILATLPPIYGLYTTLYPAVVYMFFGTSAHTSFGTQPVIALLTASIIQSQTDSLQSSSESVSTSQNQSDGTSVLFANEDEEIAFKVGVSTSVSLLSGIFLGFAGFFKLGFVTNYFSTAFVQGFTTATGVHIITSQVPKFLNIKIKPSSGAGKIIKTYISVFENIEDTNPADVIIFVISLAFLLLTMIYVNEKYKAKLKVPVPIQLILVAISTVISHFASLQSRFGIDVTGDIPSGLPSPSLPRPGDFPGIVYDSIIMTVLIYTISISMAKLTAKLHNYDIDDNQELVSYGISNTVSSFFSCFPSCNAPPRAMLLSSVGTKSTLHNISSIILILVVLLVAGPLFYALPVAVLAAMICAAIKNLLLQTRRLPFLWRTSKPDFIIWVLTCLVGIFVNLDICIIVGILVSFLTIIVKNQVTSGTTGSISANEDLILLDKNRQGMQSSDEFVIFYFPSQLFFANSKKFKNDLFSKTFDPRKERKDTVNPEDNRKDGHLQNRKRCDYVIIQCSALTYIDLDGGITMKEVAELYLKVGVKVLLSNVPEYSLHLLERVGYFQNIPEDSVFFDVHDAVSFVMEEKNRTVY